VWWRKRGRDVLRHLREYTDLPTPLADPEPID
jgi:hypothetical protein